MHRGIRGYDDQAFDNMNEESEQKKLYREEIVATCSKSRHGRAGQKNGGFRPQQFHPGYALRTHRQRWQMMRLIKDIIK